MDGTFGKTPVTTFRVLDRPLWITQFPGVFRRYVQDIHRFIGLQNIRDQGHVSSMYRSSRLRSTWNTNVITGLDMFQVCTEAVECVALFSQVWTCVTSLTKTKTLLPVKRMLSLGPWPRVLPKPYETMFIMHKNKRLLWGVHGQKRARPRTRKV